MIMKLNLAVSYKSWWMLMKKMMRYKDFYGTIEYSLDDNIFYGKDYIYFFMEDKIYKCDKKREKDIIQILEIYRNTSIF